VQAPAAGRRRRRSAFPSIWRPAVPARAKRSKWRPARREQAWPKPAPRAVAGPRPSNGRLLIGLRCPGGQLRTGLRLPAAFRPTGQWMPEPGHQRAALLPAQRSPVPEREPAAPRTIAFPPARPKTKPRKPPAREPMDREPMDRELAHCDSSDREAPRRQAGHRDASPPRPISPLPRPGRRRQTSG